MLAVVHKPSTWHHACLHNACLHRVCMLCEQMWFMMCACAFARTLALYASCASVHVCLLEWCVSKACTSIMCAPALCVVCVIGMHEHHVCIMYACVHHVHLCGVCVSQAWTSFLWTSWPRGCKAYARVRVSARAHALTRVREGGGAALHVHGLARPSANVFDTAP